MFATRKFCVALLIVLSVPATSWAQTLTTESEWMNVKGKSKAQIIQLLQNKVTGILPSDAVEAEKREFDIKNEERKKREKFLNELLQLNTEISNQTLYETNNTIQIRKAETDKKEIEAKLKALELSRNRLFERIKMIPFQKIALGYAIQERGNPDQSLPILQKAVHSAISRKSIEAVNGYQVIAETLNEGGIQVSEVIKTQLKGIAHSQIDKFNGIDTAGQREVIQFVWGKFDVYPLADPQGSESPEQYSGIDVKMFVIETENDIPANITSKNRKDIVNSLKEIQGDNQNSRKQIKKAIEDETDILKKNQIQSTRQELEVQLLQVTQKLQDFQNQQPRLEQALVDATIDYNRKRSTEERIDVMVASKVQTIDEYTTTKALMAETLENFFNEKRSLALNEINESTDGILTREQTQQEKNNALINRVKIVGIYNTQGESSKQVTYHAALAVEYGFDIQFDPEEIRKRLSNRKELNLNKDCTLSRLKRMFAYDLALDKISKTCGIVP